MLAPSYIVISPVRDEAKYLPETISSMCAQTRRPARWILVNDGSSDQTGQIIDQAAAGNPWITAVHRGNRGFRQAGTGVVEAFYSGYELIAGEPWDYISKFDGDLVFGPDYFDKCLREFDPNPKLGIVGGLCCKPDQPTEPESTWDPWFHVRGPTKIYKRQCFEEIGGLIRAPGWDSFDELKANMLGWQTRTLDDIRIIHKRPTGSAYGSWRDWVKHGVANYVAGYDPVFMALKCLRRTLRHPLTWEGPGLVFGFISGYVKGISQVEDKAVIRYVRQQQWRAMTFQPSLWNRKNGTLASGK